MESLTKSHDILAGLELVRQDYLATLSELRSDGSLTELDRNLLRRELAVEHRVRCGQEEWKAIIIQLKADQDVTTLRKAEKI
jgi:hypothetical protein